MFSKKDQNKKLTAENNAKSQAFLADYKELIKKHHFDFDAVVEYTPHGILARLVLIEFTPPSGIVVPEQKLITPR